MPTIVIDLDYTLLDTPRLVAALAKSLDLTTTQWDQAYHQFINDVGQFEAETFLRGVTPDQRQKFYGVIEKTQLYLYPDSALFLKHAIQQGCRVVILTFGNKTWQQAKLSALKLPEAVITIVTDDKKITALADYIEPGTIIVDDRADELDAVAIAWPDTIRYWMCRDNGKYHEQFPHSTHTRIKQLNEIKL